MGLHDFGHVLVYNHSYYENENRFDLFSSQISNNFREEAISKQNDCSYIVCTNFIQTQ